MIILGVFWREEEDPSLLQKLQEKIYQIQGSLKKVEIKKKSSTITILHEPELRGYQILEEAHQLLVGKCFLKTSGSPVRGENLTNPEDFIEKTWGNYLLFSWDNNTSQLEILKDPVGQIPLFYCEIEKCVLFSSELSLLQSLLGDSPAYDWHYFANFLLQGNFISQSSPFLQIKDLVPGFRLCLSAKMAEQIPTWRLENYCTPCEDRDIVKTLQSVIQSWTSSYPEIFLEFSGGLDSSAILYCLKSISKPEQSLTAVNVFDSFVRSSNELFHAERISQHAAVSLEKMDSAIIPPLSPAVPLSFKPNRPSAMFTYLLMEQEIYNRAKNPSQALFMCGQGGDEIFMAPPTIGSLNDLILNRQWNQVKNKLRDLSYFYQIPIYSLLKTFMGNLWRYFLRVPYRSCIIEEKIDESPWISKELLNLSKKKLKHPYLSQYAKKLPPGKWNQLEFIFKGLAGIHQDIKPWPDARFYPLLSQPMIELALSIPTFDLYDQGHDRYPFRSSISRFFNTDYVWRKDKGETSGVFQRGLQKNRELALSLCLEGRFAKEKLIDREKLETEIHKFLLGGRGCQWPMTRLIAAELYFSYWQDP